MIEAQPHQIVFDSGDTWPEVSVIVPLFNYAGFVEQALESVAAQTLDDCGLVVVDDASTDDSLPVAQSWMEQHASSLTRCMLVRHLKNAGLSLTRNTGTALAASEFLFFLDADNMIYSHCLERHRDALCASPAAFAYAMLEVFGAERGVIGTDVFDAERLRKGNYIDAMAMIRRDVLIAYGGYADLSYGWEDYDLWLRFCEGGASGIHLPQILARYRVHPRSMLRTVTNDEANLRLLKQAIKRRHPWVELA